jgi:hypothetical protein
MNRCLLIGITSCIFSQLRQDENQNDFHFAAVETFSKNIITSPSEFAICDDEITNSDEGAGLESNPAQLLV